MSEQQRIVRANDGTERRCIVFRACWGWTYRPEYDWHSTGWESLGARFVPFRSQGRATHAAIRYLDRIERRTERLAGKAVAPTTQESTT